MRDSPPSRSRSARRHYSKPARGHGRPSPWVLVTVIIAAVMAAGIALIVANWWLFWLSAGAALLSVPAGLVIRVMDEHARSAAA